VSSATGCVGWAVPVHTGASLMSGVGPKVTGACEGLAEGTSVVGLSDGSFVVVSIVGEVVGEEVGAMVGVKVGNCVGPEVGCSVGAGEIGAGDTVDNGIRTMSITKITPLQALTVPNAVASLNMVLSLDTFSGYPDSVSTTPSGGDEIVPGMI